MGGKKRKPGFGGPGYYEKPPEWWSPPKFKKYEPREEVEENQANYQTFADNWTATQYPLQFDESHEFLENNPVLGMQNELLPYGAIGWDPNGDPYYGDGFWGWWRGLGARILQPMYEAPEEEMGVIRRRPGAIGVPPGIKEPFEMPDGEIVDPVATFRNMWRHGYAARGDTWYAPPTIIGYGFRALQESVKAVGTVLEEAEIKTEQAIAVQQEIGEIAEEGPPIPSLPHSDDEWIEFARNLLPYYQMTNLFQSFLAPGTKEEKLSRVEESYHAGRILYSSLINSTLDADFRSRYRSGENPYLLRLEMENPMVELVGRMVISPWNLLGSIGRGSRNASRLASVYDEVYRLPRLLGDVLGDFADFKRIPAARIGEKFEDLVKAQKIVSANVARGQGELARQTGIASLTTTGKRFWTDRRVGELAQTIYNNSDLDNAHDGFRALMQLHGTEDEIATAFTYLKHSDLPPRMYLSQAGQELGLVLKNIVGDNPDKFIKSFQRVANAGDDGESLVRFMDKTLASSIRGMFPTIAERVAAGEKLNWSTRAVARFDKAMQTFPYKPFNTFFAAVYMGLSPGYAFRNMFNNSLTVLVDGGLGALRYKGGTWNARTSQWLNKSVPKMLHGFGHGTLGVETYELPKIFAGRTLAEAAEKGEFGLGASHIIGVTVEREMRRMLRPGRALPDITELINRGMPRETAQFLSKAVLDNFGDIDKAVDSVKAAAKQGSVETFRSLNNLFDEQDVHRLHEYMIAGEVQEALIKAGADKADIKSRLAAILDDIVKDSSRVADEVPSVAEGADGVDAVQGISLALSKGDVDRGLASLAHSYKAANWNSNEAFRKVLRELMEGSMDNPLWKDYSKYANSFSYFPGGKRVRELFDNFWDNFHARSLTKDFDAVKAWKELGIPGDPPPGLNGRMFRRAFWEEYAFPLQRDLSKAFREEIAQVTEDVFKAINPSGSRQIGEARRQLEIARMWDDYLRRDEISRQVTTALERGDMAGYIRALSRQFNVPTATEAGISMDRRLLNLVNKYLPEGRGLMA
jgi:hypothetical protein